MSAVQRTGCRGSGQKQEDELAGDYKTIEMVWARTVAVGW